MASARSYSIRASITARSAGCSSQEVHIDVGLARQVRGGSDLDITVSPTAGPFYWGAGHRATSTS